MSRIEYAFVMSGAASFKDAGIANVTDTYHGQILTRTRELKTAVLKDLSPKEFANELLAASLASRLGLPVPPAYIGVTEPGNPCANRTRLEDGRGLLFASVNVGAPSIASLVLAELDTDARATLKPIVNLLTKEPWLGRLYGFDTWVANIDRHIGNVLFSADAGVWIIDHGHCFTGPSWRVADLISDANYRNRLREWLTPMLSDADRKKLADGASALAAQLPKLNLDASDSDLSINGLIGDSDSEALINFLRERIAVVSQFSGLALNEPRIV